MQKVVWMNEFAVHITLRVIIMGFAAAHLSPVLQQLLPPVEKAPSPGEGLLHLPAHRHAQRGARLATGASLLQQHQNKHPGDALHPSLTSQPNVNCATLVLIPFHTERV